MFLDVLIDRLHNSIFHHEVAINYLHGRRVTDDEIRQFKLGYSRIVVLQDDGSEDFKNFCDFSYKGRKFENKIIFPVYDMLGQATGILGRAIETKEFKFYLTAEGKFFGSFFGLPQSLPKIYESKKVFVVEGPFDFFAFRKVYPNVVATMTAELTDAQYELLNFFAKDIITVFDSDIPGRKAAERAQKWRNVKTVCLGYKDPDAGLKYLEFDKFVLHVKRKVGEVLWA